MWMKDVKIFANFDKKNYSSEDLTFLSVIYVDICDSLRF